jgi:hypothetical protein
MLLYRSHIIELLTPIQSVSGKKIFDSLTNIVHINGAFPFQLNVQSEARVLALARMKLGCREGVSLFVDHTLLGRRLSARIHSSFSTKRQGIRAKSRAAPRTAPVVATIVAAVVAVVVAAVGVAAGSVAAVTALADSSIVAGSLSAGMPTPR